MTVELEVLEASVKGLREMVEPLGADEIRASAYPAKWSVADVLSHLGSGAVISALRLDAALGGPEVEPQPIWDEWNAKDPEAAAADALRFDGALVERLRALSADERDQLSFAMGPMTFDYAGFIRLRVSEHVLHSWDIAAAFDPSATLLAAGAEMVLDALPMIARFGGKPTGAARQVSIRTTAPDRDYVIGIGGDAVSLATADANDVASPDLTLPAEALIRLVYGRLDPDHTPAVEGEEATLNALRATFTGV
jgi:uncharacterized protein (TIGR03083 family)